MRLGLGAFRPCNVPTMRPVLVSCCAITKRASLGSKWAEYQGCKNWEGLLDPLDEKLRAEILRYGRFVQATYKAFNFDPSSSDYATCRYERDELLTLSGLDECGYVTTKNLQATSGIPVPRWIDRAPTWLTKQSSWIGYVAVTEDKKEISRLGRRDVVIAYRGTVTCLEWLENLRSMLTPLPSTSSDCGGPMVESGFWSLFTSGDDTCPSLRDSVREEVARLLEEYRGEPLSITVTGHSLGAALAILTAHDIKTTFRHGPPVTVVSFGGPRVGNGSFRRHLDRLGSKVLRIVNTNDVVTKVPGIVLEDDVAMPKDLPRTALPTWLHKTWVYADVGRELRVSTADSPFISSHVGNVAMCHELEVYLHLVNGFLSSGSPFRPMAKCEFLKKCHLRATIAKREKALVR
ncbi:alpha/beta-Hydrolases superfamily protein [Tasmannia lanceolata]|uniref:alpha/beta-Hydrolases superfamily protein n=1 Tax=Tasmannia lanceolata TaxID=3420 RepID=UPI004062BCFF